MRPVDASWSEGGSTKRLAAVPIPGGVSVSLDAGAAVVLAIARSAEGVWVIDGPSGRVRASVTRVGTRVCVALAGRVYEFTEAASGSVGAASAVERDVRAPMTGKVVDVAVREGEVVEAGATLVVLEAMKMEHRMKAAARMTVVSVRVASGAAVELGAVLVTLEPAP